MKKGGVGENLMLVFGLVLAAYALALPLRVLLPAGEALRISVALICYAYITIIMNRSAARTGQLATRVMCGVLLLAGMAINLSSSALILLCALMIWLVRSLYWHGSLWMALLDGGLTGVGLFMALVCLLASGSFFFGLTVFLSTQALTVLLREPGDAPRTPSLTGCRHSQLTGECGRFAAAHRAAQSALRQLSPAAERG
jgi:hypothetical protein